MKLLRSLSIAMCVVVLLFLVPVMEGQATNATVNGLVLDSSGAVIVGASVQAINEDTNIAHPTTTNSSGVYSLPALPPGRYRIQVARDGFKTLIKPDIVLNVQDARAVNFTLTVGAASEVITVEGGAPLVNTQDAAVSTVVDRQFAENLPLNGRSFQSLIQLTPGVVLTANNGFDTGQFSINGQRANANYWTVDGASANIGISAGATPGSGLAGTLGSFSVLGGTNSLVSVDAMQEFRIQTSTYAPEFGRTPGGQISIATRSGTNRFHGTVFDYFRNDALDANNWFNGFTNDPPLPKAAEKQNDFGGTFSGPILKNKTFFFFSYEGLRLRLPQTASSLVPDVAARQAATPALQPFLNAYPLPNGPAGPAPGVAEFNASYSDPATLDAYSLRVDHKLNDRLNLFGRYNYSPSEVAQRGSGASLSTLVASKVTTQTETLGLTWTISNIAANDFRFNYSSTDASSTTRLDGFGGAVPLETLPFPTPFTAGNGQFGFQVFSLGFDHGSINAGENAHNQQRQFNILDSVSVQKGSHSLKFGMDYRRLAPRVEPAAYQQVSLFFDIPSAETGSPFASLVFSSLPATVLFRNLGVFAQDTWRIVPRLTMTYGLRWDVDVVPSSLRGPAFNAVTGFDLRNLSNLALAPADTPPYKTRWGNIGPRIGLAYQLSDDQSWQTVLRGGFGVFYDLASSEAGNGAGSTITYPFGSQTFILGPNFPLTASDAAPAPILPPDASNGQTLFAVDPDLKSPYILQWNVALEQTLGAQQAVSVSYVGATGRRLIQTAQIVSPNPNLSIAQLVTNAGTSDYHTLQLQFQRRLSRSLQVLASYAWSHSIDTASAGSPGSGSNALTALSSNVNRGSSDFDVRNAFSIALTYDVPFARDNPFAKAILGGWSTQNIVQARSAPPVNVFYNQFAFAGSIGGFRTLVRPDVVAGQPFYLTGSQYPGGKALNPDAFQAPAAFPSGQGNLPRNALRGFGMAQWDFAVHRNFPIRESIKLQFRAEMFNVLNHPNFGPPVSDLGSPTAPSLQFGKPTQMLGQSLAGSFLGSGAFNPLYQIGGPRSIQLALKLFF